MGRGLSAIGGYYIRGEIKMGYFPFYANVEQLHGLIIGGGHIAAEKVERLMTFDAKLTVVAPDICEEIRQYADRITLVQREYKRDDVLKADYVIAATDIRALNEQVHSDAKREGLLVNVVDVPELCDFIFPSVVQKGKLVIGVSTSGAGPQVAIRMKNEIQRIIPGNIEEVLDTLATERIRVKKEIEDASERRKYLIELADRLLGYEQ